MLPPDMDFLHIFAMAFPFLCWVTYAPFLKLTGRGSLNSQLYGVRVRWMQQSLATSRDRRTFDSMLIGHVSNAMSFFGSATLLVLAGLLGSLANINDIYHAMSTVSIFTPISLGLFTYYFCALTLIMAVSFFDLMYALRKISYTLAMMGALNDAPGTDPQSQTMARQTATVMTESVKSLNNGIRAFYYAVASVFLFVSPWTAIIMTALLTGLLIYRQKFSLTAKAIAIYVDAMNSRPQ